MLQVLFHIFPIWHFYFFPISQFPHFFSIFHIVYFDDHV